MSKETSGPTEAAHKKYIYYGPKQGAECDCGEPFYPVSGKWEDQRRAFAIHQFLMGVSAIDEPNP